MAKTVIGLFDDPRHAQHIVHALVDDGFRREDIHAMTRQEAAVGTLSARGVPEAEADYYAEGLRRGRCGPRRRGRWRADRAEAIMERDPATNLEARTGAEATRERERAGTREVEPGDVSIPVVEEELQVGTRPVRRAGCGSTPA